ncbi:M14-type cytosolic carboxypeptidase [Erythrobacter sp. GH1-10]|uniref:M14 family metallopeptidase n=1 Tax=Erythrobacter sp. GH1-10 TaxID=3349334 RepID=UPI003877F55A
MRIATTALVLVGLLGLAPVPAYAGRGQDNVSATECSTKAARIDKDFPAGGFATCSASARRSFQLTIAPEDEGEINCSAWYAFRLTPRRKGEVTIDLDYTRCGHRYWPKTSSDGMNWTRLPEEAVQVAGEGDDRSARLSFDLGKKPVFVAAQEIVAPSDYDAWLARLANASSATRITLGQSAEGRPIDMLEIAAPGRQPRETIVLVGRQHPPEVTGALAMLPFVETLLEDSDLARDFRARFRTVVVPLLNPDGVVHGHWRHNTGGVDLNRDWGPFTQPETQLMNGVLESIAADPENDLQVLIDFHSTQRDVFYTIPDELPTDPELFTRKWLALYQERMPGYPVNRDARHAEGRPISKAHVYDTYGAPGITFEIGDETDRELIRRIGREAAVALMVTMLETPPQ